MEGLGAGAHQFQTTQIASQSNYRAPLPMVTYPKADSISTSPASNSFCQDDHQAELDVFRISLWLLDMSHRQFQPKLY